MTEEELSEILNKIERKKLYKDKAQIMLLTETLLTKLKKYYLS